MVNVGVDFSLSGHALMNGCIGVLCQKGHFEGQAMVQATKNYVYKQNRFKLARVWVQLAVPLSSLGYLFNLKFWEICFQDYVYFIPPINISMDIYGTVLAVFSC